MKCPHIFWNVCGYRELEYVRFFTVRQLERLFSQMKIFWPILTNFNLDQWLLTWGSETPRGSQDETGGHMMINKLEKKNKNVFLLHKIWFIFRTCICAFCLVKYWTVFPLLSSKNVQIKQSEKVKITLSLAWSAHNSEICDLWWVTNLNGLSRDKSKIQRHGQRRKQSRASEIHIIFTQMFCISWHLSAALLLVMFYFNVNSR